MPHPIGARFRDGLMYVTTTEGLNIYDITDPELPVPVGALPLPHFENEDVDLAGTSCWSRTTRARASASCT